MREEGGSLMSVGLANVPRREPAAALRLADDGDIYGNGGEEERGAAR